MGRDCEMSGNRTLRTNPGRCHLNQAKMYIKRCVLRKNRLEARDVEKTIFSGLGMMPASWDPGREPGERGRQFSRDWIIISRCRTRSACTCSCRRASGQFLGPGTGHKPDGRVLL